MLGKSLRRDRDDRGFTLIELLVVVVIIGVLVAIAIPVYLNYRKGAENRSVQSDVRNAVSAIESCYTDGGQNLPAAFAASSAPVSITCGAAPNVGNGTINVSNGNTIALQIVAGTPNTYKIVGHSNDTNVNFTYDSSTGQTVRS